MNKIIVNGKSTMVSGRNINVINDKVYVDNVLVVEGLAGEVSVSFEGDLASLKTGGRATVSGDVHGDVDAGGSIECGKIQGDVDAGGSVKCGSVAGSVDAGGSIKMRR